MRNPKICPVIQKPSKKTNKKWKFKKEKDRGPSYFYAKNHLCNIYNFILNTTLYFIQLYTLYYFILYTTLYFIQLSLWCPLYKMKLLSFNKFEILVSAFWQVVNWRSNLKPQNSMIWTYIFNMIYIVLHIHRKKCIWLVFSQ